MDVKFVFSFGKSVDGAINNAFWGIWLDQSNDTLNVFVTGI